MNDPMAQIISALSSARRVLITTHVRPDGDALGSVAAMALGLRRKGIDSEVLLLSKLPSKYAFIFDGNQIAHHDVERAWPDPYPFSSFDLLLVIDTGTWSQLPGLGERLRGVRIPRLVIDHHLTQESWADIALVETQAAAAGEIIAQLLSRWDVPLDPQIATALYLALVSDTGWFEFSNTRPPTLRLAASLMEAGVDTDRLYQLLYQNERAQRVLLQARAQQGLQLLADNRLAVMAVRQADFIATGAASGDTEALINIPLQIRTVEVSILLVEPPDAGPIRVSLRSKGEIDVARFAEKYGGGGHARAAGLKMSESLDVATGKIVSAMTQTLQLGPSTDL